MSQAMWTFAWTQSTPKCSALICSQSVTWLNVFSLTGFEFELLGPPECKPQKGQNSKQKNKSANPYRSCASLVHFSVSRICLDLDMNWAYSPLQRKFIYDTFSLSLVILFFLYPTHHSVPLLYIIFSLKFAPHLLFLHPLEQDKVFWFFLLWSSMGYM